MKIGIIFTAFNMEDLLRDSLSPWIAARQMGLGDHQYVICGVSVPFEGFDEPRTDYTLGILHAAYSAKNIDHLILSESPMRETESRGAAMKWLIERGCDVVWQWDADEITHRAEIKGVMKFVESRPLVAAFKGSLKNYVFDTQTYLIEPFTPMRIHRTSIAGWSADSFWDDNNVLYRDHAGRTARDVDLSVCQIPKTIAWTRHLSWLSNDRSKKKQAYQWKRWGKCSFSWDDAAGGLIWTPGHPIPETAKD